MTDEGISQAAIRRAQRVYKLLFPAGVVLAVVATPFVWIRQGSGLRNAFASSLQKSAATCAALGLLSALPRRSGSRSEEPPASRPDRPHLSPANEELVYEPGFPGTSSPHRTPFQPGGEGQVFLYFPSRNRAWTYLLAGLPSLDGLADDQLPRQLRRQGTDMFALEMIAAFPAESPRKWPGLHPEHWSNEPSPQAGVGNYLVLGDPLIGFGRRNPLIKVTPDVDEAETVAAGFARVYGVSTCVARVLERRTW